MIGRKWLSFILDGREGYGVICGLNSVLIFLSVFKYCFCLSASWPQSDLVQC